MALKPMRYEFQQDIAHYCDTVAERGVILVFGSSGSGESMDDANDVVTLPGTGIAGLKPAGMLMNDMVDIDLTKYHLSGQKDEMQVGGKCCLLRKGWAVTNKVTGTPVAGDKAYLMANGNVGTTSGNGLLVGEFLSSKDSDGYAKVEVNLPGPVT